MTAAAPAPVPPPPQATHVLAFELACNHAPPCPVGSVQDLASGDVTTIYDLDLTALDLDDLERSALRRSLDGRPTRVEGSVQNRGDLPMATTMLPVMVITGLPPGTS